jgi:putative acetyltransferase
MLSILPATSAPHISSARVLFREYAESLGFDLCFQGFEQEVANLPGEYQPPRGRLLLAYWDGEAVGCAALHDLGDGIAEMKRLYVKPSARGHGVGKALSESILAEARAIGYQKIRLDTIRDQMQSAIALYRAQGFREIEPYRFNPITGALYMELNLSAEIPVPIEGHDKSAPTGHSL